MKRRWIYWLLVIAFLWLVLSRFNELSDFSQILAQGRFQWVLVAITLQVLQYLISSASFRTAFSTVGIESRIRDLFPLFFGSMFVNVIAPAGGASGAVLFVDHAARSGQPPARAAAGLLLQLITSLIAVFIIIIAGLAYLGFQGGLQLYQIAAASYLLFAITVISLVIVLSLWRPTLLHSILDWLQHTINALMHKIHRSALFSEGWADRQARDFTAAGEAITARPAWVISTLGVLIFSHVVSLAGLYTLFLAFSETVSIGSLVAGYAVGVLFLIVSVTPQGIGIVEGIMPSVFASLGVSNAAATLTVFAFRGLTLWLPLLVGFIILRRLDVFRSREAPVAKSQNSGVH
jgi:uncharacterized protein (TIRG00374 family)